MSWKFIYVLLLLHAPARLWIWCLGSLDHNGFLVTKFVRGRKSFLGTIIVI